MIGRIRDYFYRLWPMLAIRPIRRNQARLGVPPDGFTKQRVEHGATDFARTLASAAATAEHTAAIARAVLDAMQPTVEIQAAITDADQFGTLLDLARSGDKGQFVELARCLGVPADQVETLWEGTVRRLDWSRIRRSSAMRSHEPEELTGGASTWAVFG